MKLFLVLATVLLAMCGIAHAQLTEVSVPGFIPALPYSAIEWPDSLTGYIFDDGGRYAKTTDGGATWRADSLQLPFISPATIGYRRVHEVDFRTPTFGVVLFSRRHDTLFYAWTDDGGSTWTPVQTRLYGRYGGWLKPNVYLRPLRRDCWFLMYGLDSLSQRIYTPAIFRSTNQGLDWLPFARDAQEVVSFPNVVEIASYLALDSLRHIAFYGMTGRLDDAYPEFWTRSSSDAGASWTTRVWSNGTAAVPYQFRSVRMTGDTSFAVVCTEGDVTDIAWTERRDFGTAPGSVASQEYPSAWTKYRATLDRPSRIVRDFMTLGGFDYTIQSTEMFTDLYGDSLLFRRAMHPGENTRSVPLPLNGWYLAPRTANEVWITAASVARDKFIPSSVQGLTVKILRFNRLLVQTEEVPGAPVSPGINALYPHPVRRGEGLHYALSFKQNAREARIAISDVYGRVVYTGRLGMSDAGIRHGMIDMPRVPPGLYSFHATGQAAESYTRSFVLVE